MDIQARLATTRERILSAQGLLAFLPSHATEMRAVAIKHFISSCNILDCSNNQTVSDKTSRTKFKKTVSYKKKLKVDYLLMTVGLQL